jgi:prepilin-type processing-associated H-X9-DG protein
MNNYKCPSLLDINSVGVPFSATPDIDDFDENQLWSPVSYLMPVYFQYWGDNDAGQVLGSLDRFHRFKIRSETAPEIYTNVRVPNYLSRIDRVGSPGRKVFLADGTRYLDDQQLLDHDVAPFPNHFGAFTTSGAWWRGSTAYGVHPDAPNWNGLNSSSHVGSPSKGQNLVLSYRHGMPRKNNGHPQNNKGFLNTLFYDGHVDKLTDRQSRKIELWYPKGAIVTDNTQGLTNVPLGYVIR